MLMHFIKMYENSKIYNILKRMEYFLFPERYNLTLVILNKIYDVWTFLFYVLVR